MTQLTGIKQECGYCGKVNEFKKNNSGTRIYYYCSCGNYPHFHPKLFNSLLEQNSTQKDMTHDDITEPEPTVADYATAITESACTFERSGIGFF